MPNQLVRRLTQELSGVVASPAAEARTLVAAVTGLTPAQLLTAPALTPEHIDRLDELVARRRSGIPLQHLTGRAPFRYLELQIGPGAFIPRPETEVMVEWCLARVRELPSRQEPIVVVDLCTGSGAIAAALADELTGDRADPPLPVEIHAVELSPEALAWAERNLAGTGVHLHAGDLRDALPELDGRCDLVVCNPPYIPLEAWESVPAEVRDHDPDLALFSGADGLDAWRVLADTAHRLLSTGGHLAGEHADLQGEAVPRLLLDHGGWTAVRDHLDLTGRARFTTATKLGEDESREI
ncbi:peptide chain release factor N(5)-glutamine methyltransferase [Enemella sp. A6]|uniref:peptide chain release factor N(5)-glutamine methyltransferase n=1 Tax=Enemella sp. A6 TaxID=3440152 RepID=UPI003EBBB1FA